MITVTSYQPVITTGVAQHVITITAENTVNISVDSTERIFTIEDAHLVLFGIANSFGIGEDEFGTTLPFGAVDHIYIEGEITIE